MITRTVLIFIVYAISSYVFSYNIKFISKNQLRTVLKASTIQNQLNNNNNNNNNNVDKDESIKSYTFLEKIFFDRFAISVAKEINIDVTNESEKIPVALDFSSLIQMINKMVLAHTIRFHIFFHPDYVYSCYPSMDQVFIYFGKN